MKPATKLTQTKIDKPNSEQPCTGKPETESTCCNKETQVYSRVVGYIRPTDHWNVAKKEEFENRKTYKIPKE
jgi:anaerobic ribonucleoside-triphosphate reductase